MRRRVRTHWVHVSIGMDSELVVPIIRSFDDFISLTRYPSRLAHEGLVRNGIWRLRRNLVAVDSDTNPRHHGTGDSVAVGPRGVVQVPHHPIAGWEDRSAGVRQSLLQLFLLLAILRSSILEPDLEQEGKNRTVRRTGSE